MTESELSALDKEFGIVLHEDYRKLMLDTPGELFAILDWHAKSESEAETMLFRDAELIRDLNEWVRDTDDDFEFDPNDQSVPWPADWFVIGGDCGGNFYCLDRTTDKPRIFEWQQGTTELDQVADSIPSYIRYIFGVYADLAASDFE
jgi:hypothetical protein